jgi:hypothetical protein
MASTENPIRYVTVAGAHVNVTPHPDQRLTHVACGGCGTYENEPWHLDYFRGGESYAKRYAEELTREWAQVHAEKCRAVPNNG